MIKIFDVENNIVIPTVHCYKLKSLKAIIDKYPDNYMEVLAYLFYMSCPDPESNPFFDAKETDKEQLITSQLNMNFSVEDDSIVEALDFLKTLYETPSYRAYVGIKSMLDRVANHMENAQITDGKDGNLVQLINTAAKFDEVRKAFKNTYKDLQEEQKSSVRGNSQIAYDQE